MKSSEVMSEASRGEVRVGLEPSLAGLWRYALVLSKARDAADDLAQRHAFVPSSARINLPRERAFTGGCSQFFARSGLTRYDRNEFGNVAVSSMGRIR